MSRVKARTTVVFVRPFRVPGLDEELPAGEYVLETEVEPPFGFPDPDSWRASVLIHLQPKDAAPGLARSLTLPLADPMVRLFMASDGITEAEMRRLHSGRGAATGSAEDR